MNLSERIKELLISKDVTEYRLSKITGIHKATINRITNGSTPNPGKDTLEKIAHALDMTVSELTGEDKQEKPIDKWTLIIEKAKNHNINPEKFDKLIDFLIDDK